MTTGHGWAGIVAEIERTATLKGRRGVGCGWIEGTRLHERALRAGCRVRAAVAPAAYAAGTGPRGRELLVALANRGCRLEVAPDEVVERLTEGRGGRIVGLAELPAPMSPVELARLQGTVLVAWNVEDPGNVGALARTALAASSAGLVTTGASDPFHPRAIRTSRGSVFKIPRIHLEADDALESLAHYETVGAVTAGGESPDDAVFDSRPRALLVGSEAFGLPEEVVKRLDRRITIPMSAEADSYSVNAAAAILLWVLRTGPGGAR